MCKLTCSALLVCFTAMPIKLLLSDSWSPNRHFKGRPGFQFRGQHSETGITQQETGVRNREEDSQRSSHPRPGCLEALESYPSPTAHCCRSEERTRKPRPKLHGKMDEGKGTGEAVRSMQRLWIAKAMNLRASVQERLELMRINTGQR